MIFEEDQLEAMHLREFDLEEKIFQATTLIKTLQVRSSFQFSLTLVK